MRRGLVLNLISNIVFFIAGYGIHFFLGNTLSPVSYGVVGTIMTVLDFEYMFLSNGARQSLAKEISMQHYDVKDIICKSILFQIILVFIFFCINFFGAPLFGTVLNDGSLAQYFRIAAFLVPANGIFVLILGINDGIHNFEASAMLNTIYPITKLSAIPLILFVFRDDPVAGMEIGYLVALLFCIVIGSISVIRHRDLLKSGAGENKKISFLKVTHNTLGFSFFFIMVSLVLSIDTLIVKSVVKPSAMAGYYTGAVNFGKIPYYLLTAFFTVILPVVAKDVGVGNKSLALKHVREFILLIGSFVLPIPTIISASSSSLLISFYHADFKVAASALSFLAFSSFFMGMTVLLNMVLTSFASNRFSDLLSVFSLMLVVPAFVFAAKYGGVTAIAATSMISTAVEMLISLGAVMVCAGNIITSRMMIIIGTNVVLWFLVHFIFTIVFPFPNLFVLTGVYIAIYVIYSVLLIAMRVIKINCPIMGKKENENGDA